MRARSKFRNRQRKCHILRSNLSGSSAAEVGSQPQNTSARSHGQSVITNTDVLKWPWKVGGYVKIATPSQVHFAL